MRKMMILIMVIVTVMTGLSANQWRVVQVNDQFGDPTEATYTMADSWIEGTYSPISNLSQGKLRVSLRVVNTESKYISTRFELVDEHGNIFNDAEEYNVSVKKPDGDLVIMEAFVYESSISLYNDYDEEFHDILKTNKAFKVLISPKDDTHRRYLFTIPSFDNPETFDEHVYSTKVDTK